jgi:Uma2 family endonuclease
MGVPKIDTGPMTVDEFYLFTDSRPDEEKWELIDGDPVLNASPSGLHQVIIGNVLVALVQREREGALPWRAIPGIGIRASETSRPEPDVMVIPKNLVGPDRFKRDTENALVLFEVTSPSTSSRDMKWKRATYTSLLSLAHYVVIAQDAVDVVVFARDNGFAEQRYRSTRDGIEFPALGVSLPLSEIYHDTGLS